VATVGGVGASIPRQTGKTWDILVVVLILCLLYPGYQVVWSAHHLRTSTRTFQVLKGLCRRPGVSMEIRRNGIRSANGEQQVEFANGSMIMFGARSRGFGRGFEQIDAEVFDEAQIMDERALDDMVAATNQSQHPFGALIVFVGTPPREDAGASGIVFETRRAKARAGQAPRAIWLEIGADPGSDPDDREQWPKMNPSYPTRTSAEALERLREILDDEGWNREGRGIWDDPVIGSIVFGKTWNDCLDLAPPEPVLQWLGIAVAIDMQAAAIVARGVDANGRRVLRPLAYGTGLDWVPAQAERLLAEYDVPAVVDSKGPAAVLLPKLRDVFGHRLYEAVMNDVLDAVADFRQAVALRRMSHAAYPELDAAVEVAVLREVGDRYAWGRKKSGGDISALEAATLADWAAENVKAPRKPKPDIF